MRNGRPLRTQALMSLFFFFFFFFFHLTYSRWTSSLPSCLWSQKIFPSLPGSRLTFFLSRCKFSTLTTRQPMVEFYLLTFPRFPLRKKEHKSYFGKNRTHDFRTSRCAAYLLDHSGDVPETLKYRYNTKMPLVVRWISTNNGLCFLRLNKPAYRNKCKRRHAISGTVRVRYVISL